jgi:cell division protein FtsB
MKLLITFLAILLVLLQYQLLFTKNGVIATYHLYKISKEQATKNIAVKKQNDNILVEIVELKKGDSAVSERARNELGMIEGDETFYRVIKAKNKQ